MKTYSKYSSNFVFLLSLLCIVQSCRVYKKQAVSLDDAVVAEKRVKLKTTDGKTLKYKSVLIEDGQYFGIKRVYGEDVREPINASDIEIVRLHNKGLSILYGIGVGAGIGYAALVGTAFLLLLVVW